MNTCTEHKGVVVVHEEWDCPLCGEISKTDELEKTIQDLEAQAETLEDTIGGLRDELSSLKTTV